MTTEVPVHGQYIDGEHILEGSEIIDRHDPANSREVVAQYHVATRDHIILAVEAAHRAFAEWKDVLPHLRGEVLMNASRLLKTPKWIELFKNAMVSEIGKTQGGAVGEVGKTARVLQQMSSLPSQTRDKVFHSDKPGVLLYEKRVPVGVSALITPFNFPLAVTMWKIAAALGAGCTVVLKPSPHASQTTELILELMESAMSQVAVLDGKVRGVINMVHGGAEEVNLLVRHQLVRAVSFTGSTAAGTSVYRESVLREPPLDPRNFQAEMGGDNAIVVLEDANLDMAASAIVGGAFIGEGQRCTATKRVLVAREVAEALIEKCIEKTKALTVGPSGEGGYDVGPLVSGESLQHVLTAIDRSQGAGMKIRLGGDAVTEGNLAYGNFMAPTILEGDHHNPEHVALHEEIFGPVVSFSMIDSLDEGIAASNANPHKHVGSLFTEDMQMAHRFVDEVEVGMVHVNNSTLGGDPQAGFGGLGGATSFGIKEMGPDALEVFQAIKTVAENRSGTVTGGRDR